MGAGDGTCGQIQPLEWRIYKHPLLSDSDKLIYITKEDQNLFNELLSYTRDGLITVL